MAISPQKAGQVTQKETQAIDGAEKEIDKILRNQFQRSGSVKITKPISSLSTRGRKELLRRFRAAGWSITEGYFEGTDHGTIRRSDAHAYWTFKESPARSSSLGYQIENSAPPPWRDDGPINPNWR